MNKLLTVILAGAMLCGCATSPILNTSGNLLLTAGITEGLRYGVQGDARRALIANYADDIAVGLRTITGTPTDAELTQMILSFVPANIRTQFPEIAALVVPLIVTGYDAAIAKYGNNTTQVYAVLNQLATDLENGVAPFVTQPHTVSP